MDRGGERFHFRWPATSAGSPSGGVRRRLITYQRWAKWATVAHLGLRGVLEFLRTGPTPKRTLSARYPGDRMRNHWTYGEACVQEYCHNVNPIKELAVDRLNNVAGSRPAARRPACSAQAVSR